MIWLYKAGKTALMVLAIGMLFVSQANAQSGTGTGTATPEPKEANPDDGWHASITPYMYFASMHGTAGALGHEAAVDVSFADIWHNLNIGGMATVELGKGRVLMPVDFLWMRLSDNKALPLNDPEAESIDGKLTFLVITPKIGYRIADGKRLKVDGLVGARIWHLGTTLTLQPVELGLGFSQATTWADAVEGARITYMLTPKASVMVAGDAGGISAQHDYQVGGFLGYQIARKWNLLAGFRYMSINYRPNGGKQFVLDMNIPGAVVGVTYTIK